MEVEEEKVALGLGLGLGLGDYAAGRTPGAAKKRVLLVDLSFPLHKSSSDGTTSAEDSSQNQDCKSSGFFGGKEEVDGSGGFLKEFGRKKLRLTRDQTTLLEESFRHQTTLNMAEKQALAEKLKLKPRQVEVWFQNRRARTKLKQTEVDCEFLKKNCERLLEENRRLKEELSKLRKGLPEFLRSPSVPDKTGKPEHRGGREKQAVVPEHQP